MKNFTFAPMKQVVSSFLLLIMLFQSVGYFFAFKLRQNEIRREIKQQLLSGIPDDALVLLKISDSLTQRPNSQFRWIHKGEFRFDGQLYDIARSVAHNGETWFYCIADKKETKLVADLENQVRNEMNKNRTNKNQQDNLQRLLSPFTVSYFNPETVNRCDFVKINTFFIFSSKTWSSQPDLPPPKA